MFTTVQKLSIVTAAIALAIGLAGCSTPGGPANTGGESGGGSASTDYGSIDSGTEGRAFDSTDDAVITAIKAALKADEVKWDGKSLKAYFNEGSVSDPTASIGCLAMQTLIADDETGFIVYSDGEFDCSTKY